MNRAATPEIPHPPSQAARLTHQPPEYSATYVGWVYPAIRGALSRRVERGAELPRGRGTSIRRPAPRSKYETPTPILGRGSPNISAAPVVEWTFRHPRAEFSARRFLACRLSSQRAPPSDTSPEEDRSLNRAPRPMGRWRELLRYLCAICTIEYDGSLGEAFAYTRCRGGGDIKSTR